MDNDIFIFEVSFNEEVAGFKILFDVFVVYIINRYAYMILKIIISSAYIS
jgi:hypothetical protein